MKKVLKLLAKTILYFVPFIIFILGYLLPTFFLANQYEQVPDISGKTVWEGLMLLAEKKLDMRLLRTVEDSHLTEGTILYQTPKPNSKARPNQHVFVIISKKPASTITPNFSTYSKDQIHEWCNKNGKNVNFFGIQHNKQKNTFLTQNPTSDQIFSGQDLTIYVSSGHCQYHIMPLLKNSYLNQVINLLKKYDINHEIIYKDTSNESYSDSDYIVVDQRPAEGSVLDFDKKLFVQIYVSQNEPKQKYN